MPSAPARLWGYLGADGAVDHRRLDLAAGPLSMNAV